MGTVRNNSNNSLIAYGICSTDIGINYLFTKLRYHGGWVCENIYYLGFAGVVRFGGVRIGGISGIYKDKHYSCGKSNFYIDILYYC